MFNKSIGEKWAAVSCPSTVSSEGQQNLEQFRASSCTNIPSDWTSEAAALLRDSQVLMSVN